MDESDFRALEARNDRARSLKELMREEEMSYYDVLKLKRKVSAASACVFAAGGGRTKKWQEVMRRRERRTLERIA
jgi:hypothetical protein